MKTALYIRVSTEDQVKEGYSLEAQKHRLIKYCEAQDYDIFGIYIEEGISGQSIEARPQMKEMLRDAKAKLFDAVLVFKLDRLGRNTKELLDINDKLKSVDIIILSLNENIDTSTPQGKLFFTMLAAISEMELSTITERMILGKEQKVREGKYLNGPFVAYGFEYIDEHLRQVPHEAEHVRKMFRWVKEGASIREITRRNIKKGVVNKSGNTNWSKSTVANMLRNPTYAGYATFNSKISGEIITEASNIDAIITKKEFDEVQTILDARTSSGTRKYARTSFYFADVAYCSICGAKMITRVSKNKAGTAPRKNYQYYTCNKKFKVKGHPERCENSVNTSQLKILRFFWKYIEDFSLPKANPKVAKIERDWDAEIDSIDKEIIRNNKRKSNLLKSFLDGLVPTDIYKDTLDDMIKETDALNKTKASLIKQKNSANQDNSTKNIFILNSIKDFRDSFDRLTDSQKRFFISKTIKRILISPNEITSIEFN